MSKHTKANGNLDMQAAAAHTNVKGGRNGLYALLKKLGHFNPDNTPRQQLVKQGLFVLEPKRGHYRNGSMHRDYYKPWATPAGLLWLHEIVREHGTTKTDPKAA